MSTNFVVDNSSCFPFTAQTDRQTDRQTKSQTQLITLPTSQLPPEWVTNNNFTLTVGAFPGLEFK